MSPETLRMVYFAYIHSVMSYGIIGGGGGGGNKQFRERFLKIKKKVIRIIKI